MRLPGRWRQSKGCSDTCSSGGKKRSSWGCGGQRCQATQPTMPGWRHEAVALNSYPRRQDRQDFTFSVSPKRVVFPAHAGFVAFGHMTISEQVAATGGGAPILIEQKKGALSYPFQSILTLCSKVSIVLIITDVHFCFIATRKLLVSASILPSCSCYKKESALKINSKPSNCHL